MSSPCDECWMSHEGQEPGPETPDATTDTAPSDVNGGQVAPEPADGLEQASRASLQFIVRGGTTTSAWDAEQAGRAVDAEARRSQLDADKRIASVPIEQGGGMMFTHHFSDPLTTPKVHIRYVNAKKETVLDMLCELVTDDVSGDRMLIFICPKCVMRGVAHGDAQCVVRGSHRKWYLDTRGAGEIRKVQDVDLAGRPRLVPYMYAGEVVDTDVLACANFNCGAKYKIHKNMLYDWWGGK